MMIEVQESLGASATGKSSSVLISPHNFARGYLEIASGCFIKAGSNIKDMYVYYTAFKE
jgi:hypothetical protein